MAPSPLSPRDRPTPPERSDSVRLSDGRVLAWSEWGPSSGTPVLFCTGAAASGSLGFGAAELSSLGLRLLGIDRPGLGRSDPHPGKTLSTWADDVGEMIDARGLTAPLAVGFSQGAPFALALASRGLVRAVAIVSGQDELNHPLTRPLLHPDVAGMVAAAEADPAGFEAHFGNIATAEGMWRLVVETSAPRDRAVYLDPTFAAAFEAALREGFRQGPAGYARDLAIALGPWPFALESISAPVDLWYGAADASPVHSPDLGATLAKRLPRATRHLLQEEGGSLLWTRAAEILRTLSDRVNLEG